MKFLNKLKDENGEIVVEATFVFPIVIFVVFIIIQLGLIMYQQTLLNVVANDTAASIAQISSTQSKDPFIGYTNTSELSKTKLYRNLYNAVQNAVKSNSADSLNQQRAAWYARYRLVSNRLYRETGTITIETSFERQPGTLLQKTIVVNISANYDLSFFRFFGVADTTRVFTAEGRAQCFDLLDYASTLGLVDTVADDIADPFADAVVDVKGKIESLGEKIREFASNID